MTETPNVPATAIPFKSTTGKEYRLFMSMGEIFAYSLKSNTIYLCDDHLRSSDPLSKDMLECIDQMHRVTGIPL